MKGVEFFGVDFRVSFDMLVTGFDLRQAQSSFIFILNTINKKTSITYPFDPECRSSNDPIG